MALNKFLFFEVVDISDGNSAIVKNYYPDTNFVVLYAHSNNSISSIKAGMRITGRSSGYSKTLSEWNYSTLENDDLYDLNYSTYDWQSYQDRLIGSDKGLIVPDEIYNSYPRDILGAPYENFNFEILDFQFNEGIILDN